MAMSTVMQSITSSPGARVTSQIGLNQVVPSSSYVPRLTNRTVTMRVRSMAEQESQKEEAEPPVPVLTLSSQPSPNVSRKLSDMLAFSGPAPEIINGRLAMTGFVVAIEAELASGEDVFQQLANGGITTFLSTNTILSATSQVPLFKGVNVASKTDRFMTSNAKLWNGRFAMLGLVALAFTEFVKSGALV